ncbi:F-box protein GID2 [Ananas comosus]|uniref:F-box protein GID2 n=1 Tax=Ananas comosus TaxID=4615 RepID=A0A6P5G1J6_ANACO|nr:F-box protein GID2 [Ananas comosus]
MTEYFSTTFKGQAIGQIGNGETRRRSIPKIPKSTKKSKIVIERERKREEERSAKKLREEAAEGSAPVPVPVPVPELGEDAIYEVLRRADARTLAAAACVSRRWRRLAADERLWEAACVRHWEAARDYGGARLRPVVLALGGFRRLHSLYLAPLLRPPHPSPPPIAASSSSPSPIAASSPSPSPIAAWPMERAGAGEAEGGAGGGGEEVGEG